MTPWWLLPADARTFETRSSGLSLVVQENFYGDTYYRFVNPDMQVSAPAGGHADETVCLAPVNDPAA